MVSEAMRRVKGLAVYDANCVAFRSLKSIGRNA